MTVNTAAFKTNLRDNVFDIPVPPVSVDAPTMIGRLVSAYESYVADATDSLGNTFLSAGGDLSALWLSGLQSQNAITAGTNMGNGVLLYWMSAMFTFTNIPPGGISGISNIVTIVGATPGPALGSIFSDISTGQTADAKATSMSNALHAHLITVMTTLTYLIPAPPGPPIPMVVVLPIS